MPSAKLPDPRPRPCRFCGKEFTPSRYARLNTCCSKECGRKWTSRVYNQRRLIDTIAQAYTPRSHTWIARARVNNGLQRDLKGVTDL